MIQLFTSWFQHGWHPGHLFELAFLMLPVMAITVLKVRVWWAKR